MRLRELLQRALAEFKGGSAIFERVMALDPALIEPIKQYVVDFQRISRLDRKVREGFDEKPAGVYLNAIRKRIQVLHAFLDVDKDRRLAHLDAPIRRISHAHLLRTRSERAKAALNAQALGELASQLISTREQITSVMESIGWARTVHSSSISGSLKEDLLSERASQARNVVRELSDTWNRLATERQTVVAELRSFKAEAMAERPHEVVVECVSRIGNRADELAAFLDWRSSRKRLEEKGLGEFLALCDRELVAPDRIPGLLKALIAERRAASHRRVGDLATNSGTTLDGRRRTFAERDRLKLVNDRADHSRQAIGGETRLLDPMPGPVELGMRCICCITNSGNRSDLPMSGSSLRAPAARSNP